MGKALIKFLSVKSLKTLLDGLVNKVGSSSLLRDLMSAITSSNFVPFSHPPVETSPLGNTTVTSSLVSVSVERLCFFKLVSYFGAWQWVAVLPRCAQFELGPRAYERDIKTSTAEGITEKWHLEGIYD